MKNIAAVALLLLPACDAATEVRVFGEAFAEVEIPREAVSDGWSIRFSELVVSIGDVRISGESSAQAADWYVFDVAADSGGAGHPLASMAGLPGEDGMLHYRIAAPGDITGGNASDEQIQRLAAGGYSVYAAGAATRGQERVAFEWGFPIDLAYDCPTSTPRRGEAGLEITVHADHLFADDLELEPELTFDTMAEADADADGIVTPAELAAVELAVLDTYGTTRSDIDDLWTFVGNLATTMGHVNGEGSCTHRFVPDAYAEQDELVLDADAERGALVFEAHCASCHGETGQGGGPAGTGLTPAASNLAGAKGPAADHAYLQYRVEHGGAAFPYASAMPAYADSLSREEIEDVVAFVHSLQRH